MNDWCWISTPRMLTTNSPSTICPRSQGMHTLLVSTVTHTHTHTYIHTHTDIWSIRPWSAAVDSDWPTKPTRFSEIGNTRLHSPLLTALRSPTHGPVSEWSAPRHFTRGVLALGQSEGFVRPFWGFWMRLVIRWLTDYGELTHSVWSIHGISQI